MRATQIGVVVASAIALAAPAQAQDVASFYRGKTLQAVVGYTPGSTFELYLRTLVQHMGRHVPGQPTIVIQHMPGAGHVLATNYIYNVAPKDGTAMATLNDAIPLHQALDGAGVRFDARRFNWIGASGSRNSSIYVWHTAGVKSFKDVQEREVIFGSTGAGSGTSRLKAISGWATSCRNKACRAISASGSAAKAVFGIRAKDENSSTIRRRSPTWRTIVPVSRSNVAGSESISLP